MTDKNLPQRIEKQGVAKLPVAEETGLQRMESSTGRVPAVAKPLPQNVQRYFTRLLEHAGVQAGYGDDWLGHAVTAMSEVTSLSVVGELLKERGLPSSAGSWEMLIKERLRPALEAGQLSRRDILSMLQEMEEHGRQHVLLYRLKPEFTPSRFIKPIDAKKNLLVHGLDKVFDSLPSLRTPESLTLTHVRYDDTALTLKALEVKESREQVQLIKIDDVGAIRLERVHRLRRAKIARLHHDGLLEIRLGSLNNARVTHSYEREATEFLRAFNWLIELNWFIPADLGEFKKGVWTERRGGKIQVLRQAVQSDAGNQAEFKAKNRETDAAADEDLQVSRAKLIEQEGSSFGKTEVRWVAPERGSPRADIAVRVPDGLNANGISEFFIGQATSGADYDHVFRDIRRLGKL